MFRKHKHLSAACLAILLGLGVWTAKTANSDDTAFRWRGNVDDTVQVYVQYKSNWVKTTHGEKPKSVDARVYRSFPQSQHKVYLLEKEGRGDVSIFQQPSSKNDYTTGVRIRDYQGGRSNYKFTLTWK